MTDVVLEAHEIRHAALIGVGRNLVAKRQRRRPLIPGSNTFLADIAGAVAELVVAKALGVYWAPNVGGNDHVRGDVGMFQVRSSAQPFLVIRDRDLDEQPYVLVTGQPPDMSIRGWLYAREAKTSEYRDPGGGWAVPAQYLRSWEDRPA